MLENIISLYENWKSSALALSTDELPLITMMITIDENLKKAE